MQIFVKTLTGETIALDVESDFKVEEVKEMVAFMTEVDTHHQSVFYSDRQLQDEMILSDVPIKPLSTLTMKEKLMGGSTILGVTFADVTSKGNFITENFGPGVVNPPIWAYIEKGLNFRGTCRNSKCPANNQIVYVKKGFCPARNGSTKGCCNLNEEISEISCPSPKCLKPLTEENIHGIYIYKCSLRVRGKVVGQKLFDYTVESRGECFKRALSMCDNGKRVYASLSFYVAPLTDLKPPADPISSDVVRHVDVDVDADADAELVSEPETEPETEPEPQQELESESMSSIDLSILVQ
eukprot:TRINITY_DN9377_c0_g1_i3.p1 TRINITY_DN9377_c0_g1~~TRINITY_DN9377_c0_g1_i3.p1  ORF type:complete len:297 (+),score=30.84 TRINITY_DN9377_c0_g1_i3:58-948(+)